MLQSQTQIYRSQERGLVRSEVFSRYSVFNFENTKQEADLPFGALEAMNDETLCPKNKIMRHVDHYTDVVIIPLSGSILYKDSLGNQAIVETEQIGIFSVQEGMVYELMNLYEEAHVNYLQIWLRADEKEFRRTCKSRDFDQPQHNTMFPVFAGWKNDIPVLKTNAEVFGHIGVYNDGRNGKYTLKNSKNGLFAFVINGSFDFNGRTLHARDAMTLSGIHFLPFVAKSENAAVLLIEIPI